MITIIKITIESEKYPYQLRKIKNSPQQLYLNGNRDLLNKNIISIIGSRNCTENGRKLARKFARELSEQGIVIASGMAKGIDSEAHEATLNAGGKTIAVLGNGFNHIFPEENKKLYNKILENNGLVVSEYAPETKPDSNLFLERNRIVSGISIGILVIEAAFRSGTSVTAKLAKEQDRKVFVLPHEIDEINGVGTNKLIRKGAILVTSTKEIIDEFSFLDYNETQNAKRTKKRVYEKIKNKIERNADKTIVKEEYKEIYELIENGITSINDIYRKSNKSIGEVNKIIFMLEVEEYIQKKEGGYVCV